MVPLCLVDFLFEFFGSNLLLNQIANDIRYGLDVFLDGGNLFRDRRFRFSVVREQIRRDLVFDKQIHERLCQLNFLGECSLGKIQEFFELRLDLNDADANHGGAELHFTKGLGKFLLFRRKRGNAVPEFFGTRQDRCQDRNQNLVLVVKNNGLLGQKVGRSTHPSDHQHETRKLVGPSDQEGLVGSLGFYPLALQPPVQEAIATNLDVCRRCQRYSNGRQQGGSAIAFAGNDSNRRVHVVTLGRFPGRRATVVSL